MFVVLSRRFLFVFNSSKMGSNLTSCTNKWPDEKNPASAEVRRRRSCSKSRSFKDNNQYQYLTEEEKEWIKLGWSRLEKNGQLSMEDLVGEAWIQAALHSPGYVWAQVGITHGRNLQSLKQEPKFTKIIYEVRRFLQRQIVEVQLDTGRIRQECYELGARHTHYFKHVGMAYWDSFNIALADTIERALNKTDYSNDDTTIAEATRHENIMKEMYAWHKFISMVIEEMRAGYMKHFQGDTPDYENDVSTEISECKSSSP